MSTEEKKEVDLQEYVDCVLENRVIIRGATQAEISSGGIFIPEVAKQRPDQGVVVLAGPGFGPGTGTPNDGKMTVVVGDNVLFSRMAGIDINIEGEKFMLMRENDIFCILKKKECKTNVIG